MARPKTIADEDILAAAREVFLEQGFGATTAEVARRAQVSEGSVFKRFHSKYALFSAAMLPKLESVDWTAGLEARVGVGDLKENLTELAHAAIAFFRGVMPLMMMSWSNPGPNGIPDLCGGAEPPPVRAIKRLSAYFAAEMDRGRLRPADAEVVARMFSGSIIQFVMFELMQLGGHHLPLPEQSFVRSLVALLWSGVGADECPVAPRVAQRGRPPTP